MTLQELIDMPGYGSAKKELMAAGKWKHLLNDTDRIEWLAENVSIMKRDSEDCSWKFKTDYSDYCEAEYLREDIDNAADVMETET